MICWVIWQKWAFAYFAQNMYQNAYVLKLSSKIPLFWNSIFRKSSYRQSKKKKKKIYETRVPCEFFQITRFSSNRVSKYGHFATSFRRNGQMPILAWVIYVKYIYIYIYIFIYIWTWVWFVWLQMNFLITWTKFFISRLNPH